MFVGKDWLVLQLRATEVANPGEVITWFIYHEKNVYGWSVFLELTECLRL